MKIFLFSFQGALFASKYIIRGGIIMKMTKKIKLAIREAALEVYDLSKKAFNESKGKKVAGTRSRLKQQTIKWHAKNK